MNPTAYSQTDGPSNWGFYRPYSPEMPTFVDPTHVESYGRQLKSPEMDQHLRSIFPELSNAQDRRREFNIQYGYAQKVAPDQLDFSEFINFDLYDDVMVESLVNDFPQFESSYYSSPASFGTSATTLSKSPHGDSGIGSFSQPSPASANSPYGLERQASSQPQQPSQQENAIGARTMVFTADMEVAATRTRAKYTPEKRKEVAEVRKRGACDECKKRKKKCKHVGVSQVTATPIRRPRDSASTLPYQRIAAQLSAQMQEIHTLSHVGACHSPPGHPESAQASSPGDFRPDMDFILFPESPEDPMDRWLAYNDPTWPISQPQMEAGIITGITYAGSPLWSPQQVETVLRRPQGMAVPNESAASILPEQSVTECQHTEMLRFTDGDLPFQYQGGQFDNCLVPELMSLRDEFGHEPNHALPQRPTHTSNQGLQGDHGPSVARSGPHRRGPWSLAEDNLLLQLVQDQGPSNWVRIAEHIQTRTPKQCRERYHQSLKPTLNNEPISQEEGLLIESLVGEMGKKWTEIARRLPGRSDNAVKNWWNGGMNRRRRMYNPQRDSEGSLADSSEYSLGTQSRQDCAYREYPMLFTRQGSIESPAQDMTVSYSDRPRRPRTGQPDLPNRDRDTLYCPIRQQANNEGQRSCGSHLWTCCADVGQYRRDKLKEHIASRHTPAIGSSLFPLSQAITMEHTPVPQILVVWFRSTLFPLQQIAAMRDAAELQIVVETGDSTNSSLYPPHQLHTGQDDHPRNTFLWDLLVQRIMQIPVEYHLRLPSDIITQNFLYQLLSRSFIAQHLESHSTKDSEVLPFSVTRKEKNPLLYSFAGYLIWIYIQDPWACARLVLCLLLLMFLRFPNSGYR